MDRLDPSYIARIDQEHIRVTMFAERIHDILEVIEVFYRELIYLVEVVILEFSQGSPLPQILSSPRTKMTIFFLMSGLIIENFRTKQEQMELNDPPLALLKKK